MEALRQPENRFKGFLRAPEGASRAKRRANPHRVRKNCRRHANRTTGYSVYANNNPVRFIDPDGREVEVTLRAYTIGHAPIKGDYGHQYIYLRDTDSGVEMISRAGPSAPYPGGVTAVTTGSPVRNPDGEGNVTLVTELGPASKSVDANPVTGLPLGNPIKGSEIKLPGNIEQAARKLQGFNNKVERSNINYKPLSTNSNAYAGTAYTELTGKSAPDTKWLPGSEINLKDYMDKK